MSIDGNIIEFGDNHSLYHFHEVSKVLDFFSTRKVAIGLDPDKIQRYNLVMETKKRALMWQVPRSNPSPPCIA